MSKTMFNKDLEPLKTPIWRLVGPDFETWELRGEVQNSFIFTQLISGINQGMCFVLQ